MKFLRKSIKTRMIVLLGTLIFTVCMGMGLMSYFISSKALISNTDEVLPQMASEAALLIENQISGSFDRLDMVSKSISIVNVGADRVLSVLKEQEIGGGYLYLGIADKAGILSSFKREAIDIKEMEFFQKALSGENAVSDPIMDIFTSSGGDLVVVYAFPIIIGSNVDSVLIAVKPGDEFNSLIDEIAFGKTGKAFMINKSGEVIAHTDLSLVMDKVNFIKKSETDSSLKPLANTLIQMTEGNTGAGNYTYKGIDKYAGYAPVKETGWSIAITGEKNEILSGLTPLRNSVLIFSLVFLILGAVTVFVITSSITNSLIVIVKNISLMAGGDLTNEVPDKYLIMEDEIGVLANSIRTMQNFIRDMLLKIMDSSTNIDEQSENLSAISQEISAASENVTTAIQDVAKGAGAQAEDLSSMIGTLNHFANELDNIVHAINDIDKNANSISSMAENSSGNMQLLVKSSSVINGSFKDFVIKITGFGVNVNQINEIANLINEVADQTNLLALNASIEAARAGDAGRGFAVVADQIRKLAEQTKKSSVNINSVISSVSGETNVMVKNTNELDKELNNQLAILGTTIESFEKIITSIKEIAPEIEAVNASAFELDGEKNAIIDRIEGVASIAEEVSASSEEIAASSEEMNASMEEVSSAAQVLTDKTREMMEQVKRFKI